MKSTRRDACEDHLHPGTPVEYLPTKNVNTSHRDKIRLQSTQVKMHLPLQPWSHGTASSSSCHGYCQNPLLPLWPSLSQPPASLFSVQQHLSQPCKSNCSTHGLQPAMMVSDTFKMRGSLTSSGKKEQGLAAAPPQPAAVLVGERLVTGEPLVKH